MRLSKIHFGFLIASIGFSKFAFATPDFFACPTEISVEQKATESSENWTVFNSQSKHPFINISFSEGDPSQRVILAPSREKQKKGAHVNIWNFSPSSSGYWVSCIYSETSVILARKLPSNTKSCEIEYDKKFSSPVVKSFKCS